jgi:sterol desaturase/sphingolipid hydroxylase (fatty acid hydroxylase superfamily)
METIIGILFPVTFIVMLLVERKFPARELPKVRFWLLKCIVFFVLGAVVGGVGPVVFASAVHDYAPLDLSGLGGVLGGLVAFVASELAGYATHRLLHNIPWLWRWTHQMHHSAERVDVAGSAYFHPFDTLLQTSVVTIVVGSLGVSTDAAALAGYLQFFAGMFQHLNVRTPQWLGYVIQRPEAHAVHHARGVHAYNYGNFIMLWDMLLGTFRNPVSFTGPAGFWDGASAELGAMLIGRDVGEPAASAAPHAAIVSPTAASL